MSQLNTMRHDALFDRHACAIPIHVIGAGGVGSHVAYALAKLGVGTHPKNTVTFYDGDTVELHNPANQAFLISDVGKNKAEALAEHFKVWSGGNTATAYQDFVTKRILLSGVVFLCLDSMGARKDICEASIWNNPDVAILIETRMDANNAVVFTVNPNSKKHIEIWNRYWFPDDQAQNLAGCGGHLSVITAVMLTASIAVQQFIAWTKSSSLENVSQHVRTKLNPWETRASVW